MDRMKEMKKTNVEETEAEKWRNEIMHMLQKITNIGYLKKAHGFIEILSKHE